MGQRGQVRLDPLAGGLGTEAGSAAMVSVITFSCPAPI
jgi:hypothetical protein